MIAIFGKWQVRREDDTSTHSLTHSHSHSHRHTQTHTHTHDTHIYTHAHTRARANACAQLTHRPAMAIPESQPQPTLRCFAQGKPAPRAIARLNYVYYVRHHLPRDAAPHFARLPCDGWLAARRRTERARWREADEEEEEAIGGLIGDGGGGDR